MAGLPNPGPQDSRGGSHVLELEAQGQTLRGRWSQGGASTARVSPGFAGLPGKRAGGLQG